jgi:RecA/RadA recombinase
MSLLDKLKKNTTIKDSAILSKSKFFTDKDVIPTDVPMINVALSGRLDGGLVPGLTMLAGPSKHFKTAFALLMASAYQKKYPDAAILFYDSEFGTPQKYFETFNIDMDRVLHTPITDVEQLKHDIVNQLLSIEKNDKVIIVLDSIGNLASRKEVDDATEGKTVADMSRAKQIK